MNEQSNGLISTDIQFYTELNWIPFKEKIRRYRYQRKQSKNAEEDPWLPETVDLLWDVADNVKMVKAIEFLFTGTFDPDFVYNKARQLRLIENDQL